MILFRSQGLDKPLDLWYNKYIKRKKEVMNYEVRS